ncbi:hypothetical protein F511_27900 [Dorcoceras hygrometricum]|uniref:Uncharacterized protein n=1 Tax=Dorcoceras hygrometricum TaxID=472368 RepID=A0A2Z7BSZ0_9LAMI|nr:hypothetical protein F511_27900 [Dorcoceras hygrometricum]
MIRYEAPSKLLQLAALVRSDLLQRTASARSSRLISYVTLHCFSRSSRLQRTVSAHI